MEIDDVKFKLLLLQIQDHGKVLSMSYRRLHSSTHKTSEVTQHLPRLLDGDQSMYGPPLLQLVPNEVSVLLA